MASSIGDMSISGDYIMSKGRVSLSKGEQVRPSRAIVYDMKDKNVG
jgi:hypothetical protein